MSFTHSPLVWKLLVKPNIFRRNAKPCFFQPFHLSGLLLLPDFPFNLLWPIAAPGQALETFVGEDVNTMLIVNLLSGTEYSVKVIASYTTGSSEALTGKAKTCEFSFLYFDLTSQFLSCIFGSTSNFLLHNVLKQDKQNSLLWLYTMSFIMFGVTFEKHSAFFNCFWWNHFNDSQNCTHPC